MIGVASPAYASPTYRREIDGLCALAVLPVIFFHAGFDWFRGGFVGVDVFFVISGYLITTVILTEQAAGTFSLVRFYERRARRILPALFFMLALATAGAWVFLLPVDLKAFAQSLTAVAAFYSNVLFSGQSGYFDTAAELKPLLHTWSLAVEEQFYLLFPVLLLLTRRLRPAWIAILLVLIGGASLAAAELRMFRPAEAVFLLQTRGWAVTIGALAALYVRRRPPPATSTAQLASALHRGATESVGVARGRRPADQHARPPRPAATPRHLRGCDRRRQATPATRTARRRPLPPRRTPR